LERIDRISLGLQQGGFQHLPEALTIDLSALFSQYGKSLEAWKSGSDVCRGKRIRSALAELYREEARIPPTEPADSTHRTSIRSKVSQLHTSMRQMLGAAALAAFETLYHSGGYVDEPSLPSDADNNQLAHELLFDRNYQLNTPRMEQINARLRAISPTFVGIGVEFERQRFIAQLKDGLLTQHRARESIHAAVAEAIRRGAVSQDQLVQGSAEACEAVHLWLMLTFALNQERTRLTKDTVPETLRFDVLRLNRLRSEFLDLTTRSAMLTTVRFAFRSMLLCPALAALTGHICTRETAYGDTDRFIAELGGMMDHFQLREVALENLKACVNPDDMVHRLM
jgi:hypothetical protein